MKRIFLFFCVSSLSANTELMIMIKNLDAKGVIGALALSPISLETKEQLLNFAQEEVEKRKKEKSIFKSPDDRSSLLKGAIYTGIGSWAANYCLKTFKFLNEEDRKPYDQRVDLIEMQTKGTMAVLTMVISPIFLIMGLNKLLSGIFLPEAKKNLKKAQIIESIIKNIQTA